MEDALAEFRLRLQLQRERVDEEQQGLLSSLLKAHKEDIARLEAENAELQRRLQLAERGCAGDGCCNEPEAEDTNITVRCVETAAATANFPGWGAVLASDMVRVRAIAEDGALTISVHRAILQRSPYFEARLASRWSEPACCDSSGGGCCSALALRLPAGCPAGTALLLFQHLYADSAESFGLSELYIKDAAAAIAVAQLANMLLLDRLQEDLSHLACGLLHSTEEAFELQRRFVTLPAAVSAVCRGAFDVPAASMAANDLARMLQGTARSPAARPKAEAVLAAHGRTAACVEAVAAALEAMPFKIGLVLCSGQHVAHIDRDAFKWLWGLVQEYLLFPGSGASLLGFFRSVASFQEDHSNGSCQAPGHMFDDTRSLLQAAFGGYLLHLASSRSDELPEAFRLGVLAESRPAAMHRSLNCRIRYPNALRFDAWSKALLPRLLRAAGPLQPRLQAELMELPPNLLADLVDDTLLQAFGGDMAAVCSRISEDPAVLMQWVTRRRLLAVPLVARRSLCMSLVPSLGALPRDIAAVVVQVMAGTALHEERTTYFSKSGLLPETLMVLALALVMLALLVAPWAVPALLRAAGATAALAETTAAEVGAAAPAALPG